MVKIIEGYSQFTIQQFNIGTNIQLTLLFPPYIFVCQSTRGNSVLQGVILPKPIRVCSCCRGIINFFIDIAVSIRKIIRANSTQRASKFHVIDKWKCFFKERLFANVPGNTYCRKQTISFIGFKPIGTIICTV
ncbi:hypothetical protein D3C73_1246790 [compost metagenome]